MNQSPFPAVPQGSALAGILAHVSELMTTGDDRAAIAVLLGEQSLVRSHPLACNTLAYLLLRANRIAESIAWFEAVLALTPADAQALSGLGMAYRAAGDFERALQYYEAVLVFRWKDFGAWYQYGTVLAKLERWREALFSLDKAIELKDDSGPAFRKRAEILKALGEIEPAIASAARGCALLPREDASWLLLGDLLQMQGHLAEAISAYDEGLACAPQNFFCLCNKARALKDAGRKEEALLHARAALGVEPSNHEALLICATLAHELGHAGEAHTQFLQLAEAGPVRGYAAARRPASLRALLLFSPVAGNTPYEDLILGAGFDAEVFFVLPGHFHDPAALDARADVIVNLVSDADLGRDLIAPLADFADRLHKPVVNHPRLILPTDRESIALRLAGLAGTVVPATRRIEARDLAAWSAGGVALPLPVAPERPAIVRHAGTHGGDRMELVSQPEELAAFAAEAGDQALYLTEFVDYRSADGCYRKYRFVFVGEEILPYHLAIGDGWKVHHASTRMGDVEWMRAEESAFLSEPERVFGAAAMAALADIRRRVGLDYFGIDCALDAQGRVIVFEVNASMLIHLHNEGFDYKTPHVMRIKAAFEQLLEARAAGGSMALRTAAGY